PLNTICSRNLALPHAGPLKFWFLFASDSHGENIFGGFSMIVEAPVPRKDIQISAPSTYLGSLLVSFVFEFLVDGRCGSDKALQHPVMSIEMLCAGIANSSARSQWDKKRHYIIEFLGTPASTKGEL
ncbi:hypothetical protein MKW98_014868, partial [Papaver atlanticum]